jgi:FO synthase
MLRHLTDPELETFPALDWSEIFPRLTPTLRASLEKVLETQNGADLSLEESYALANSQGDDLLGLLVAANMLRADLAGNIVTYVVNRNINFTNICFVGCKFCAFSRGPREADTYFLTLEQMAEKAREAWQLGATEVCIQGGLPHGLPKFHYRDILRAIKSAVPGMHIHAFSPMEIVYGVELTGMPLADYLSMLRDNGLGTLPGTAAEILDDEIRHILSANKLSTARLHRIRPPRIRAPEHDPLPPRAGAHWPHARRASQSTCAGPVPTGRIHQQHSSFVGEVEPEALATLPARGC